MVGTTMLEEDSGLTMDLIRGPMDVTGRTSVVYRLDSESESTQRYYKHPHSASMESPCFRGVSITETHQVGHDPFPLHSHFQPHITRVTYTSVADLTWANSIR